MPRIDPAAPHRVSTSPRRPKSRRATTTTPACAWSKRRTSSPLTRRVRPTNARRRRPAQGGAGLQHGDEEIRAAPRAAAVELPGLELPRIHQSQARQLRCRARGLRSRAQVQTRTMPRPSSIAATRTSGLNRLSEAKEAYLALFAGNRKLAASLLAAMQEWVGEHRGNAAGVDGADARVVCIVGERAQHDREPDRGAHARRRRFRLALIDAGARRARRRHCRTACAGGHGCQRRAPRNSAGSCPRDFPSPRSRPTTP